MAKHNLAYKNYQYKTKEEKKQVDLKVVNRKKSKLKTYALRLTIYLIALVSVFVIISTHVAIAEISYEIGNVKSTLKEEQSENTRLNSSIESKVSRKNIEEKASSILAMSKEDKSQVEYIYLSKENKSEILSDDLGFFGSISNFFRGALEYIKNIFNIY